MDTCCNCKVTGFKRNITSSSNKRYCMCIDSNLIVHIFFSIISVPQCPGKSGNSLVEFTDEYFRVQVGLLVFEFCHQRLRHSGLQAPSI